MPTTTPEVIVKSPQDGQEIVSGEAVRGHVAEGIDCDFLYVGFRLIEDGQRIDNLIYPQGPLILTEQGEFGWGIHFGPGKYDLYVLCVNAVRHEEWKQDRGIVESGATSIRPYRFGEPGVRVMLRITVTIVSTAA